MEEKKPTGYPSIDKPWLKYYSEEAKSAKLPEGTLYEYLKTCDELHPDDMAIQYFGKRISYKQMLREIERTATAFHTAGVRDGDIVSFCTPSVPEVIYGFYALNKLGGISNWIDPRTNAERMQEYLCEANSKLLVVLDIFLPVVEKILSYTMVEKTVVISVDNSMPTLVKYGYRIATRKRPYRSDDGSIVSWREFIRTGRDCGTDFDAPFIANKPAVIMHTGGTTGDPKGVLLSNENFNSVAFQYGAGMGYVRGQKILNIMPPFIAYGLCTGIHMSLCHRGATILISKFDPQKFDALIIKHRPERLVGVPSYFESLLTSSVMVKQDLSFLVNAAVGGDHLNTETEEKINAFFTVHHAGIRISKGFAMTELCAGAVCTVSDACNVPGSVGIPLPLTTVSIFDTETPEELSYNQEGEICITGPTMMLGYYKNDEESSQVMQTHEDGRAWIHSGDIGYMDEDGVLFIVDRIKRMIVRHDGFKVYPSIIENVITQHDGVSTCAVVGMPDSGYSQGMLPKAFIVLKNAFAGREAEIEQELKNLCAQELAEYALPAAYVFCDSLPLTPIGKVDYRALEQMEIE